VSLAWLVSSYIGKNLNRHFQLGIACGVEHVHRHVVAGATEFDVEFDTPAGELS
jgi:hypothetical protein